MEYDKLLTKKELRGTAKGGGEKIIIMTVMTIPVYAMTEETLQQAPDLLSPERVTEIQELKEKVAESISSPQLRIGGKKLLSVANQKQINTYYCGPASTAQTLGFLGISKSQSALGTEMGTNLDDGTILYKIRDTLNKYLGSGTYKYVATSELSFASGLQYSILNNKPVICQVSTGALPVYKTYQKDIGHYVVATGYDWFAQGSTGWSNVIYNDPNYDSRFYGTFECNWTDMQTAIKNHHDLYIMGA